MRTYRMTEEQAMDAEAKEAERANGDDGEEMVSCDECEARKPLSQMRSLEEGGWVCSAHVTNAHVCRNCEGIQPETCLFNPERVKERSEAMPPDDDGSTPAAEAYDAGAEAMRAACLEAVQEYLNRIGCSDSAQLRRDLKSVIEGAAP